MELERGVQRDDERGGEAQQHMEVQPVASQALPAEPRPVLAQGVEEDDQEHGKTKDAELDPDASAGPEQHMLRHERAVIGAGCVVIKAISQDAYDQGDGNDVAGNQAQPVTGFRILCGDRYRGLQRGWGGGCAHFCATCSSVVTENCL